MTTTATAYRGLSPSETRAINELPLPAATVWEDRYPMARVPVSAPADHGYDWIDQMNSHGWASVSMWGEHGWDLGEWPYDVTMVRTERNDAGEGIRFAVAQRIEGDLVVRVFNTFQERCDYIDRLAWEAWGTHDHGPDLSDGYHDVHRGPFGKARADWAPPRHVMPGLGVPYADRMIAAGKSTVVCPVCFKHISEDDATGPQAEQLRQDEATDYDGLGSKVAGLAYAIHFQTESEAGR